MILILLGIATIAIGYFSAKYEMTDLSVWLRIITIFLAWLIIGGIFNLLAIILLSQALYVPSFNYFSGKDIWFIDDNTKLGKFIIEHLGQDSGRVWFFIQLIAAILILVI